MAFISRYALEVRSYELDVYNHVNNAVYVQWLEHGRSALLQDKGLSYTSIIERWGVRFMTVRTEIDYRRALGLGDRAEVLTQVERVGNSSVRLDQRVVPVGSDSVSAEAKVVIVFTDAATGRPTPVPAEFTRLFA